jgi:hypothetical protein
MKWSVILVAVIAMWVIAIGLGTLPLPSIMPVYARVIQGLAYFGGDDHSCEHHDLLQCSNLLLH